ncbi:MAG TPA: ABC transporter permease [Gemmatimonadaceae bacterium]|nr:ABC transporter permease [Gemmatimonadaceae bacterium]
MPFLEAIRLALDTLRVQKLKSFFTLLGVMIGVMFLVAVFSIVQGMSDYVEHDFAGRLLGVNTFNFRRRPNFNHNTTDEQWREFQRRPRIYAADAALVRSAAPPGSRSAIVNQYFPIYAASQYARPRQVFAITTEPEYFTIKQLNVENGRAFVAQEVTAGARVIVIGTEVASHFFPDLDPVGRELRIRGTPYTVIGVLEKQGSVFGFSLDRYAIAPWTSPLQRVIQPRGDIQSLVVQAASRELMLEGIEASRELLRGARHLPPGRPDNFALETEDSALEFFEGLKSKMIIFGSALPAIGLIVGAMVIMNIMLVAVAERTREIGIRKALGARRRDIMSQFLVEATTLSVVGAAIGITLGIVSAKIVAALSPLPASVAPWSIAIGLLLGAGVGIVAGVYPASRAALLDPIAALRQE